MNCYGIFMFLSSSTLLHLFLYFPEYILNLDCDKNALLVFQFYLITIKTYFLILQTS